MFDKNETAVTKKKVAKIICEKTKKKKAKTIKKK